MTTNREQALQTFLSIARNTSENAEDRIFASRFLHELGQSEAATEVLLSIARDGHGKDRDQFEAAGELWKMEQRTKAILAYTAISNRLPANDKLQKVPEQAIANILQGEPAADPFPGTETHDDTGPLPAPPPGPPQPL